MVGIRGEREERQAKLPALEVRVERKEGDTQRRNREHDEIPKRLPRRRGGRRSGQAEKEKRGKIIRTIVEGLDKNLQGKVLKESKQEHSRYSAWRQRLEAERPVGSAWRQSWCSAWKRLLEAELFIGCAKGTAGTAPGGSAWWQSWYSA